MASGTMQEERRRQTRVTLIGSVLITPSGQAERAETGVLDNVNRRGAGLHANLALRVNEPVVVSIAFLDQEGDEQQEKLAGHVAWTKAWEKGYLIGVVWDEVVTPETHRWLDSYLTETLRETA